MNDTRYLNVEQKYFCEKCKLEGSIFYGKHEDVLSVVYRIEDDHNEKSPQCEFDTWKVRTIE